MYICYIFIESELKYLILRVGQKKTGVKLESVPVRHTATRLSEDYGDGIFTF